MSNDTDSFGMPSRYFKYHIQATPGIKQGTSIATVVPIAMTAEIQHLTTTFIGKGDAGAIESAVEYLNQLDVHDDLERRDYDQD